jgi:hypothetical protein
MDSSVRYFFCDLRQVLQEQINLVDDCNRPFLAKIRIPEFNESLKTIGSSHRHNIILIRGKELVSYFVDS